MTSKRHGEKVPSTPIMDKLRRENYLAQKIDLRETSEKKTCSQGALPPGMHSVDPWAALEPPWIEVMPPLWYPQCTRNNFSEDILLGWLREFAHNRRLQRAPAVGVTRVCATGRFSRRYSASSYNGERSMGGRLRGKGNPWNRSAAQSGFMIEVHYWFPSSLKRILNTIQLSAGGNEPVVPKAF